MVMSSSVFVTPASAVLQVKTTGRAHGNSGTKVRRYFGPAGAIDLGSEAYTVSVEPGVQHRAHFHHVDQFQVFFGADDTVFQNRRTGALFVHYTDADTLYGPFHAGDAPYMYMTFRRHASNYIGFMPENRDEMALGHKKRHHQIALGDWLRSAPPAAGDVTIDAFLAPYDDRLAGYTISAGPDTAISPPSPAGSGGQYLIVAKGDIREDDRVLPQYSIGWTAPSDGPVTLQAGPEGASLLLLQFGKE
jgi:hypothetical protein